MCGGGKYDCLNLDSDGFLNSTETEYRSVTTASPMNFKNICPLSLSMLKIQLINSHPCPQLVAIHFFQVEL